MINLEQLQFQLCSEFGCKIDIYHSEEHRGVLAVRHNEPLHPLNIVFRMSY